MLDARLRTRLRNVGRGGAGGLPSPGGGGGGGGGGPGGSGGLNPNDMLPDTDTIRALVGAEFGAGMALVDICMIANRKVCL